MRLRLPGRRTAAKSAGKDNFTRDLSGKETGAKRDIILLNAGIAIYLGKPGITMQEGIRQAAEMIDSGKALAKLEEFVAATES